jgi:high-affinity Fe2+/Pb2+ permease
MQVCVDATEVDLIKFMTSGVSYHDTNGVLVTTVCPQHIFVNSDIYIYIYMYVCIYMLIYI